MIATPDFIKLPYTPDLTDGGIAYAVRSIPHFEERLSGSVYAYLRQIVGSVAVELAFRRYLGEQGIPFEVENPTTFSEPDKFDVFLGGHRCEIHTFITSKRNQIAAMRRDPGLALLAPALISEERFLAANHTDHDLNLFAFLLGLITNSHEDIQKAADAGQNVYLLHPLRSDWARPLTWTPLGHLALKSECASPVEIEIGGQDKSRNPISETLILEPLKRTFALNRYCSLAYIHASSLPEARLGVHSPGKKETYLIQPHEWGNIWIYGMEIWLAGYIARDEFRRKSSTNFTGSRVFQYSKTQTKNLSIPVADLHALDRLFKRVQEWRTQKKTR